MFLQPVSMFLSDPVMGLEPTAYLLETHVLGDDVFVSSQEICCNEGALIGAQKVNRTYWQVNNHPFIKPAQETDSSHYSRYYSQKVSDRLFWLHPTSHRAKGFETALVIKPEPAQKKETHTQVPGLTEMRIYRTSKDVFYVNRKGLQERELLETGSLLRRSPHIEIKLPDFMISDHNVAYQDSVKKDSLGVILQLESQISELSQTGHDFYLVCDPENVYCLENEPSLNAGWQKVYRVSYDVSRGGWVVFEHTGKGFLDNFVTVGNGQYFAFRLSTGIMRVKANLLKKPPIKKQRMPKALRKVFPFGDFKKACEYYIERYKRGEYFCADYNFYAYHINRTPLDCVTISPEIEPMTEPVSEFDEFPLVYKRENFEDRLKRELKESGVPAEHRNTKVQEGWVCDYEFEYDKSQGTGRFYLSINPKRAVWVYKSLYLLKTMVRQKYGINFHYKMAPDKMGLERADGLVVYFGMAQYEQMKKVIMALYMAALGQADEVSEGFPFEDRFALKSNVSPMTKEVTDNEGKVLTGVRFAEQPVIRRNNIRRERQIDGVYSVGNIRASALNAAAREVAMRVVLGQKVMIANVESIIINCFMEHDINPEAPAYNMS